MLQRAAATSLLQPRRQGARHGDRRGRHEDLRRREAAAVDRARAAAPIRICSCSTRRRRRSTRSPRRRSAARCATSRRRRDVITVLIAHRLSTVMHADRIYVLERGRIVEAGPPRRAARAQGAVLRDVAAAGGRAEGDAGYRCFCGTGAGSGLNGNCRITYFVPRTTTEIRAPKRHGHPEAAKGAASRRHDARASACDRILWECTTSADSECGSSLVIWWLPRRQRRVGFLAATAVWSRVSSGVRPSPSPPTSLKAAGRVPGKRRFAICKSRRVPQLSWRIMF